MISSDPQAMGDPGAAIPTPQPERCRAWFGAFSGSAARRSLAFVSWVALTAGVRGGGGYRLAKTVSAARAIRRLARRDMVRSAVTPRATVEPETCLSHADGVLLDGRTAQELPLARRHVRFGCCG